MTEWISLSLILCAAFGYGFFLGWWARGRRDDDVLIVLEAAHRLADEGVRIKVDRVLRRIDHVKRGRSESAKPQ